MDQIYGLPKAVFVFLVLLGAVIFFIVFEPPVDVCDSQISIFKQEQEGVIYIKKIGKEKLKPKLEKFIEICKVSNSPGGCFELISSMRSLTEDLRNVPNDCADKVSQLAEVKKAILDSLELMARIAWGGKPPEAVNTRFGWLDTSDITLFCELYERAILYYGQETVDKLKDKLLVGLPDGFPGAETMPQDEAWKKSAFYVQCSYYR